MDKSRSIPKSFIHFCPVPQNTHVWHSNFNASCLSSKACSDVWSWLKTQSNMARNHTSWHRAYHQLWFLQSSPKAEEKKTNLLFSLGPKKDPMPLPGTQMKKIIMFLLLTVARIQWKHKKYLLKITLSIFGQKYWVFLQGHCNISVMI